MGEPVLSSFYSGRIKAPGQSRALVVIGGIYFAVGQRAINSGRSTFRPLLNALERSPYFSLFPYIQGKTASRVSSE